MTPNLWEHLRRMRAAYLVLVIALIPTYLVYRRSAENVLSRDHTRFEQVIRLTEDTLKQRMENYISALRGARGLFDARHWVTPAEWEKYAASIDLRWNYQGMMDIGFAQRVNRDELADHVAWMQNAGFPRYRLDSHQEREDYFPMIYLSAVTNSPNWAPGWDLANETNRLVAMNEAGTTDRPIATGKTTLLSPDGPVAEPGFVIYLPVYRDGVAPKESSRRKDAVAGFVFASFRGRELGQQMFGKQANAPIDYEVFDGETPTRENLLFDSDNLLVACDSSVRRYLSQQVKMPGLGRIWTLHFSTLPAFELDSNKTVPPVALGSGLLISVLLFLIAVTQANARAEAERMTATLRQSEESLRATNQELQVRIQERQRAEAALAEEKERLAVTLRSIGDGVITADIEGKVVLFNQTAETLTGWTQEDARGRALSEVFPLINEQSRERCADPVERVMRTGERFNQRTPAVLTSREGREWIIVASSAPIRDPSGKLAGVVLAFRDVTENRKLEAELSKASKLESLGLLAGGIAHDFNNILTGIFGNISLARMFAGQTSGVHERLDKAEQSCQRAKDMTSQLLTFARGGSPIKRTRATSQLVKESCDIAVLGSNVRCEFTFPPGLWAVDVDQTQIGQAINNILLNAVQAMPDGGIISVRAENVAAGARDGLPLSANYVRISIRDQGPGIVPEHLPRIFDPFFTTKFKGRGLGLATAYSIMKKHDGLIEVESRPGEGATFHIWLPASAQDPATIDSDHREPQPGEGRVLVMDDEPDILNFAHAALSRLGYEVELARDGAEAIRRYTVARLNDRPFAAVIMDLTIPGGMGGKEAIRQLREIDPQVRAIVSSGYSNDPVMAEFRGHGFLGVVAKPYEVRELARVLRDVIQSNGGAGSGGPVGA
jgi:PAS domain S-box-containing protein